MKFALIIEVAGQPRNAAIVTTVQVNDRVAAEIRWNDDPTPEQIAGLETMLAEVLGGEPESFGKLQGDAERHAAMRKFLGGGQG